MISFIYNNQSVLTVIGIVLFLVILYFIVKSLPIKVQKKATNNNEKSKDLPKEEPVEKKEKKYEPDEEKTQEKEQKQKKEDKKPKIVQIYKREEKVTEKKEEKIDPIYDRNVEFINTSKNISKFKSFSEPVEVKEEQKSETEEKVDEYGFVQDKQDDCEFCESNVKHFDHSKRLSSIMKDESGDEMFSSHISDHYLNINAERHLNLNEKFNKTLFSRTEQMMSNSDCLAKTNDVTDYNFSISPVEENNDVEIEDDEVKINMKTALIADTYFHRKKKK